jgi:hypothetical protein
MVDRGVVDDQFGHDLEAPAVCFVHEPTERLHIPEPGIDGPVVGDVVAIVTKRRRIEGKNPDGRHAEIGDVFEPGGQPGKVPEPVAVPIAERTDRDLVEHGVLVPVVGNGHPDIVLTTHPRSGVRKCSNLVGF